MGQWVGPGQITKNQINLDLIEIILFCLKIYDLLRHPHLWVGVWVVRWMGGLGGWVVSGHHHAMISLICVSTHKATAARCLSRHQATYGQSPSGHLPRPL